MFGILEGQVVDLSKGLSWLAKKNCFDKMWELLSFVAVIICIQGRIGNDVCLGKQQSYVLLTCLWPLQPQVVAWACSTRLEFPHTVDLQTKSVLDSFHIKNLHYCTICESLSLTSDGYVPMPLSLWQTEVPSL